MLACTPAWTDCCLACLQRGGCCAPEVLPPLPAVVEAFRRCVIELAPLLASPTIPAKHINNFIEYQVGHACMGGCACVHACYMGAAGWLATHAHAPVP